MGGPTLFLAIVIKHGVSYKACKQHSPDATFTGISKKYSIRILCIEGYSSKCPNKLRVVHLALKSRQS